ncbi:MAG: ArnT family glycosyltransferase, partial [Phycisphaerales bacterium JB038]
LCLRGVGQVGLRGTEPHRVIPALAMAEGAPLAHPEMFGASYTRKPPGSLWAIATSLHLTDVRAHPEELEAAARRPAAVATVLLVLACFLVCWRWYGPRPALLAGLTQALTPVVWMAGRTAEIEPFNNAATAIAVWLLADLVLPQPGRGVGKSALLGVLTGLAIAAVLLCKGPAGAPVLIGALLVGWWLRRGKPSAVVPGLLLAAVLTAIAGLWLQQTLTHPPDAQIQSERAQLWSHLSHFLWDLGKLPQILTLAPAALALGLPGTLALLFLIGKDARHESGRYERGAALARTLAFGCLLGLAIQMALGMHNPRYTLPTIAPLCPVVAWVAHRYLAGAMNSDRRRFGRALLVWIGLGSAFGAVVLSAVWLIQGRAASGLVMSSAIMFVALLSLLLNAQGRRREITRNVVLIAGPFMLWGVWLQTVELAADQRSAKPWGATLAADLPGGGLVWANDVIEACPELLLYAALAEPELRFEWRKDAIMAGELPQAGDYLLLREHEYRRRYLERGGAPRLHPVGGYAPPKHPAVLFEVLAEPLPALPPDPFAELPTDQGSSRPRPGG